MTLPKSHDFGYQNVPLPVFRICGHLLSNVVAFGAIMVASQETIQRVVATYLQAAEANRNTPARQGNVVVLTSESANDVMVTADLHGNRLNFKKLLEIADLNARPRRHLVVQEVCHGGPTYPSGGCMSHLMLEDVARLKTEYPERFHFILSNHELAELTDFTIVKSQRVLNLLFRTGLQEMYGSETPRVRDAYFEFLRTCPLAVRTASGVFICHSLPDGTDLGEFDMSIFERPFEPADLAPRGAAFRLVWGRDYRVQNAEAFAKALGASVLIHGHEPCPDGCRTPNDKQIILDCCGERARYVILPIAERMSHQQIVERIRPLN